MDHHDVARQIEVEHQMLAQLMEGVRITTGWQVEGNDASRKLSTLHSSLSPSSATWIAC